MSEGFAHFQEDIPSGPAATSGRASFIPTADANLCESSVRQFGGQNPLVLA